MANYVMLTGRLTRDPEIRYAGADNSVKIASYSIAVDRVGKKEGTQTADFVNCKSFGSNADFVEKYLTKGTKILIQGRLQTGSYTKQDGTKVYTTDVIADKHEFLERKSDKNAETVPEYVEPEFMSIPEGAEEELPFN